MNKMKRITKLDEHDLESLDEANMRLSTVSGKLLNAECERKVTPTMSQALADITDIQASLRKFYNTYK
jgi:hypothetical protein